MAAVTLPDPSTNAIFHDQSLFELEMQSLFVNDWSYVGMADQLSAPNTWFVHDLWSRSVVVAKNAEGQIHAFVNSCAHRGTRLCSAEGTGSGRIQCPYHGWVYDCSGRLLGASSRAGLPPFKNEDYGLTPLSVGQIGQFLFVNSSPMPRRTLSQTLGDVEPLLKDVLPPHAKPLLVEDFLVHGNWKLAVSGAIEDYHLPFVHGKSFNRGRKEAATPQLFPGGHSSFFATRVDGEKRDSSFKNTLVFPATIVINTPGFVHVTTCIPQSVDRTLHKSRLYPAIQNHRPLARLFLPLVARRVSAKGYREDKEAVELAHRGTATEPGRRRGPTHIEEQRVEHLLDEVARRVGNLISVAAVAG